MAAATALVFAGKSVATPVISFIVNKAFRYLSEWRQDEGMEAVKNRLLRRLTEIEAVYAVVNLEQIHEQSGGALDQWLWRFRDAVEDAEDVLDEIDYFKLREEARTRNLQDQVRNPVTNFFREKVVDKFAKHASERDMVKKLGKTIEDLDGVAEGISTFLQLAGHFDSHAMPHHAESRIQETSSLMATEIFGRVREKQQITRWLTDNLDEGSNAGVPVFAVIGIGVQ
ncbi:hypothetical protein QOZ80_9BG0714340 [Eleusine coracana subsp. coracana]|nr:hypothetical protein QOZ80_9BG0714340 [Eleusine coracana subsp. coracana]